MADDWRVTIDFDDEGDGTKLAEWLAAVDLEGEERSTLGDRVIVSRDGPRVYLYADSEAPAREVLSTVSARIEHEGQAGVAGGPETEYPAQQRGKAGRDIQSDALVVLAGGALLGGGLIAELA